MNGAAPVRLKAGRKRNEMANGKVYRDKKTGAKLYPVCSWEHNQHKLYNAHDRIMNAIYDGKASWEELERVEKAMSIFDGYVIDGTVYATWEDGLLVKDYIWAYNARH